MEPRRNCARLASVAEAPVHLIPHRRRRRHQPHRSSPFYEAEVEDVVLVLGGVQIQKHTRRLYVWRSNLTEGAPEDQVFQQLEPILVDSLTAATDSFDRACQRDLHGDDAASCTS